jgi:ribosomal protein S14
VSFTTLCGALPDYAPPATARAHGWLLRQRILSRVLNGTLTRNPHLTVLARLNGKKIELPYGHSALNFLAERPLYESEFNRLLFGVDEAGGKTSLDALQKICLLERHRFSCRRCGGCKGLYRKRTSLHICRVAQISFSGVS